MKKSKYTRISDKTIYHKVLKCPFTRNTHGRKDHMGLSYSWLRSLFFLTENWRCTTKSVVWFQDYMNKPCRGNSRKIVGKKNIPILYIEKWRRI